MRVVIFGFRSFGLSVLSYLENTPLISTLYVTPKNGLSPEASWGINSYNCKSPVVYYDKQKIAVALQAVQEFKPDLLLSAYFPFKIPNDILAVPKLGGYNFHGGLLPQYRGALSSLHVILNGEKESGASCHLMTDRFDEGDVFQILKLPVKDSDYAKSLYMRTQLASFEIMKNLIGKMLINEPIQLQKQIGEPQYFSRKIPHNGEVKHNWSTEKTEKFIKALDFFPYKGAVVRKDENAFIELLSKRVLTENKDHEQRHLLGSEPVRLECANGYLECFEGRTFKVGQ